MSLQGNLGEFLFCRGSQIRASPHSSKDEGWYPALSHCCSQKKRFLPRTDQSFLTQMPKVHLQVVHFYWNNKVLTPPLAPSLLKIILGFTHVNLCSCLLPLHQSPTQATLPPLLMSPSHVVTIILVKVSVLLIHYAFLKKISCWFFFQVLLYLFWEVCFQHFKMCFIRRLLALVWLEQPGW